MTGALTCSESTFLQAGIFLVWKIKGQIYIPPFPNIHETGQVCLGEGNS